MVLIILKPSGACHAAVEECRFDSVIVDEASQGTEPELVAAVAVGTIIGFILDNWFDTKPILIIIFFLFGAAAGIMNVFKAAKRMQDQED